MMQIDFSDFMLTKIDRQVPLLGGGSQGDWVTARSFGYPKHMTAIEKLPFGLDLTDDILRGILDGWKPLGERLMMPWTNGLHLLSHVDGPLGAAEIARRPGSRGFSASSGGALSYQKTEALWRIGY